MTPVDQTIAHDPPNAHGDCFRCVIASLMDLQADQVPHFSAQSSNNYDEMRLLREWLKPHGLGYFEMNVAVSDLAEWRQHWQFHHVISGRTARGPIHACVGFGGAVVHDPHPSRAGVHPDEGMLTLGFLCRA